ncbi:MAG: molybdopterin molybdenumtransferase MoeA, partial [Gemmatimonadetes bacterium]|nr:molybdopterin molybdenumtransferase MoeA [Gemmatimonadota bacterium]
MKPLVEVQRSVLASVRRLEKLAVPIARARGLVLADDVAAPHDVPPFANSAMDGYAVQAGYTQPAPSELMVIEDVAAGHVARMRLEPGCASKIMTGAPLPVGADAVVPVEQTTLTGDGAVVVTSAVGRGDCIGEMGEDVRAG